MTATASCSANLFEASLFRPATRGVSEPAEALSYEAVKIEAEFTDFVSSRRSIHGLLDGLIKIYASCLIDNWDGYGAKAVSLLAINKALGFSTRLSPEIPSPEYSAEPDGEVAVEWYGPDGATLSVSIGEGDKVSYSALFSDGSYAHGKESYERCNIEMLESLALRVLEG